MSISEDFNETWISKPPTRQERRWIINHIYRNKSHERVKILFNEGYRGAALLPTGTWAGPRAESLIANENK